LNTTGPKRGEDDKIGGRKKPRKADNELKAEIKIESLPRRIESINYYQTSLEK